MRGAAVFPLFAIVLLLMLSDIQSEGPDNKDEKDKDEKDIDDKDMDKDKKTEPLGPFQEMCTEAVSKDSKLSAHINPPHQSEGIKVQKYTTCRWILDLSTSLDPFQVSTTYFNERDPSDVKDDLEAPDTLRYLEPVKIEETEAYNVFPYFVVVRGLCDEGAYGDSYYHGIFNQGLRPNIHVSYVPPTSRAVYSNSISITFRPSLINLKPDEGNRVIPNNSRCLDALAEDPDDTKIEDKVCFPAFAVPMMLLNIPTFEVKISAIGPFEALTETVYLTPFHSRRRQGVGQVEVARVFECTQRGRGNSLTNVTLESTSVLAKYFFPKDRHKPTSDFTIEDEAVLVDVDPESDKIPTEGPFFPLDNDDFFYPQYTHGTAPSIAIAGFYRPDLVIIGDPDMISMSLLQWNYNPASSDSQIFRNGTVAKLKCMLGTVPMYATPDYDFYRTRHRRHRYAEMEYFEKPDEVQAIFEIISLEDRFLLITTEGLVSFYGQSNITVSKDNVYKSFDTEKRHYCYKFVRIMKSAQMGFDPIVAVTHDYSVGGADVYEQEVHFGEYRGTGEPLTWVRLGKDEYADRDVVPPESGISAGTEIKQTDLSEAIKICAEAKRALLDVACDDPACANIEYITDKNDADRHECIILDGSAVPTRPDTVQLLVSMTFTFIKDTTCIIGSDDRKKPICNPFEFARCLREEPEDPENPPCNFNLQRMRLYLIAEHRVRQVVLEGSSWKIRGAIAQTPCRGRHVESVKNILPFAKSYFGGDDRVTCFEEFHTNHKDFLILSRMTYTRQITNHLYVFGNRLLHSSDAGQSFILTENFPYQNVESRLIFGKENFEIVRRSHQHTIKMITFGSNTQFAFLTSKRELWVGTSGFHNQIRIRPSPGASMAHLTIYEEDGIHQATPITVLYDAYDRLYELVAVKNAISGEIVNIVKRTVDFELIHRNQYFVDRLRDITNRAVEKAKAEEGKTGPEDKQDKEVTVQFDVPEASLHCAFNGFLAQQNYSKTQSRLQKFYTAPPFQHKKWGIPHNVQTLKAYQVATFSLIYESFLKSQEDFYSQVEKDPFELWKKNRGAATFIGYIKYYKEDHRKYGIVVDPRVSIREKDAGDKLGSKVLPNLYFNYNTIVQLEMTFFIKNTYLLAKTNFRTQRLDLIQMNVDNANGNYLRLDTQREVIAKYASVKFIIHIQLLKHPDLKQTPSGQGLIPVPLTFHFIGAFGTCFDLPHWGMVGESLSITVLAGCPPATDLLFDWKSTLNSLRFRHKDEKYGDPSYCDGGAFVCFYAREQVVFHFDLLDMSKQVFTTFSGKYKMRVIGGGHTNDSIRLYTPEEQEAYNIPGQSDVSLIWTTAQPEPEEKGSVQDFKIEKDPNTQENILESGLSRIKWSCNTLSPCARVAPTLRGRTVFWFLINITNLNVDPETLCHHERQLMIMVYGFPPSPETLLLSTLLSCVIILLGLYLMYYCCRGHRKVWRSQKLKIWGWVQIVTDTFPKPLKNRADMDEKAQLRKDSILLSLQGHLRVPSLLHKPRRTRQASQGLSISIKSSDTSLDSRFSSDILPQVHPRKAAATWTEMVYEQIISRRLLAIVERNTRMRDAILRKVQSKDDDETDSEEEKEKKEKAEKEAKKEKEGKKKEKSPKDKKESSAK